MAYKSAKVYTGSEWVDLSVAVSDSTQRAIGNVSGTSYTLTSTDYGKELVFSNGSSITVTIPAEATTNFTIGQTFVLFQKGAGVITVSPAAGVTLRSKSNYVKTAGQYSELRLIKIASDEWALTGDLSA
jgi:hypothetical protein